MRAQKLDRVLSAYRIGDPHGEYPIFNATGSMLYPGRWNTAASPMVYASEHYSTAMLEILANGNGHLPPNRHFVEITIPNGLSYEVVEPPYLPGWDDPDYANSQPFGERWQQTKRSVLLIVPSVVARMEHNFLFNPHHPEFRSIRHSLHRPVWWDARLFSRPAP